jgi:hypothetical protein
MATPSIQTLITQAQQVLNLKSSNEIRATLAAVLANANVGTPLNPNLTTQQLWDEFYEIVRQPSDDILSIITDQMMRMVFSPPAPGGVGADKQVIFNDGGVLAGDAGLMYNKATDALTITGDLTVRTNKLAVTSTGIGINQATPTAPVHAETLGTGTTVISNVALTLRSQAAGRDVSIQFSDGSNQAYLAMLSGALYFGTGGANTRYQIDATGISTWSVAGTTAMTLNANGLGIGVAPSVWASGFKELQVGAGSAFGTNGSVDRTDVAANWYYNSGDKYINATGKGSVFSQSAGAFSWLQTNTASGGVGSAMTLTPAMTLDASGNLLVGTTSALQISNNPAVTSRIANLGTGSKGSVIFRENEVSAYWGGNLFLQKVRGTSTAVQSGDTLGTVAFGGFDGTNYVNTASIQTLVTGAVSAGVVPVKIQVVATSGGVELTNTATSWAAISDERLKDIIEPINNAVSKVGLLRSVIGKYKSDSEGTRRSFLIAQDVQSAIPEAVGGNEDSMTVRYTEVIPLLVAAIKELTARVQTLEAR